MGGMLRTMKREMRRERDGSSSRRKREKEAQRALQKAKALNAKRLKQWDEVFDEFEMFQKMQRPTRRVDLEEKDVDNARRKSDLKKWKAERREALRRKMGMDPAPEGKAGIQVEIQGGATVRSREPEVMHPIPGEMATR